MWRWHLWLRWWPSEAAPVERRFCWSRRRGGCGRRCRRVVSGVAAWSRECVREPRRSLRDEMGGGGYSIALPTPLPERVSNAGGPIKNPRLTYLIGRASKWVPQVAHTRSHGNSSRELRLATKHKLTFGRRKARKGPTWRFRMSDGEAVVALF